MREITVKLYQFDELSDKGKKKALSESLCMVNDFIDEEYMREFNRTYEQAFEDFSSDEYLSDFLVINNYEFTIDGTFYFEVQS